LKSLEQFRQDLLKYRDIAEVYADEEMSKLRSQADRKLRDVGKRLDNLRSDSSEFEENITDDSNAMDKYSERIYERVQETLDSVPELSKITLRNLNHYVQTIRDNLAEQDKVLIKYVKLLKGSKYRSRVRSIDRSLKSLNKDLKSLEEFIKNEYAPSAGVESAYDLIENTVELLTEYEQNYEDLLEHEAEVIEKQQEIDEIRKDLQDLKNHPIKEKYEDAVEEYESVQREIDYAFSHVRKVFRKYDKYVSKNRLSTDTQLLSDMVTDAASAMAAQPSVSSVENLLKEIDEALEDTALNLSRDKRENAKEDIEKFLNGKLEEHYNRASKVVKTKEQLDKELESLQLDNKIEMIERDLAAAIRDSTRIYRRKLRAVNNTTEEIEKNVDEIKKQISSISDEQVQLNVQLPDLPDWVESEE